MQRRTFLMGASGGTLGALALAQGAKAAPSERVRVGVVGGGGRALSLLSTFSGNKNAQVVGIADIDSRKFSRAVELVRSRQGVAPRTTDNFQTLIDDKSIDAIVIGAPDHWHAIPTILACQAGKDVYVEKPDSHNIVEGRRMVEAMKKHGRVVQMGSQHRSTERLQSAMEFVASGALGTCLTAKAWESTKQGNIGHVKDSKAPPEVNYDRWLGSAPKRPFNIRRFHGHWRWFYDYGTGDLGNDGVHRIDMAIAVLNAACKAQGDERCVMPRRVSSIGGKIYFDDMQEFPDTLQVTYEYAGKRPKTLSYEMRLWAPYQYLGESEGSAVFGDKGYIVIGNRRWRVYDRKGLVKEVAGESHEGPHVQNFIDCIKSRKKPYCDLETVGHPASVLCHTGNLSARLGRELVLDAKTETFVNDEEANQYRGRPEWRKPYELPTV